MNLKLAGSLAVFVLIFGMTSVSQNAFAEKSGTPAILKKDLKTIMADYSAAISKAKIDFSNSIKKANSDAKSAIKEGIPIDQINAASQAAIAKARSDYKLAVEKAKSDVKTTLLQIVYAIQQNKSV